MWRTGAAPNDPIFWVTHESFERLWAFMRLSPRVALKMRQDPVLEPACPPLIQPEVLPRVVRHEVARPRVRHLVANDIRKGAVAREQRRRRVAQS